MAVSASNELSTYSPLPTSARPASLETASGSSSSFDTSIILQRPASRWLYRLRASSGWIVAALLLICSWKQRRVELKEECWDPYRALGYIHRPPTSSSNSIRWIPYPPSAAPASNSFSLADPARVITDDLDLPAEALKWAAPDYGDMLRRRNEDQGAMDGLEWSRGRRVVFVGDSHDRSNVEAFCNQHSSSGAVYSTPHYHIKAHCNFPDLNLTLTSWFHYGVSPAHESEPPDAWNIPAIPTSHPNENPSPYSIEERLREVWVPDAAAAARPELIVLNSFFWDVRYFAYRARHFNHSLHLQREERALTYSELAWHRARVQVLVESVREAFPGVPVMFRLGQQRRTHRNEGNVAVYQMNQSLRALMAELRVPIFEWAKLITGESHYNDDQHLSPGAPATLFGDMALYYLKRAVEGWDKCPKI
ncbi:hypothetical protein JCM21900_002259 [Sporobolomyces salmonicolor]